MLHEAIFLATCNATMTNKKPFKLQRGCHTFATFFATCNAYNNKQDSERSRAKDELWLAHSDKIVLQVAEGLLHASNLSRNVAKSRGSFYLCCNSQRNNCSRKMGCYTWIVSCNATFVALQVAKNTVNQWANVTQWPNYLPQRAEIWIIQRSHLAPQRAKNTMNEQPNTYSSDYIAVNT